MKFLRPAVMLAALLTLAAPVASMAQVAGTANFPTSAGDLKMVALGYRASNVIKAPVYNLDGKKIGQVVDIIITQQAAVSYLILDVGGFLGIGSKQIAVPARDFQIINKKVVLPGVTAAELKQLPAFQFSKL